MIAVSWLPLDDVQQVVAAVWILYAVESAWWLRGDAVRIYAGRMAGWTDRPPESPPANGWRLGFTDPLPWSESFAAEPDPFPCDGEWLLVPVLEPTTGRERYEAIEVESLPPVAAAERDVRIGERTVGSFSGADFARIVAGRLERIRSAPPADRAAAAEEAVAESWSLPAARARLDAWRDASAWLRWLGGLLTLVACIAAPLVWTFRGQLPQWLPAATLAVAGGLWLATAVAGLFIPAAALSGHAASLTHRLIAFLSPVTAMRLHDTIGRDVLIGFEPLVVALTIDGPARPDAAVAAMFRDVLHPAHRPQADPPGTATGEATRRVLEWRRSQEVRRALEAVRAAGLDPLALRVAPPDDPGVVAHCPRCGRGFVQDVPSCDACGVAVEWHAAPDRSGDSVQT